jgi:VCBS repeat-containing protein
VGRISASDPDAGDRLTYSLAEDAGGRFAIDAESGRITVSEGAGLDFEEETSHRLMVRVTDSGGLTHEGAVAIGVTDANESPWAEANTFTVKENAPAGTSVGRISAGDPDGGANGTLSYAITDGDSAGRFAIDAKTGRISVADGSRLDFETDSAFKLTVTVTDESGLGDTALVTVDILDSNEPPEDLGMTGGTVAESAASGTLVATLLASDPDAGERLTYRLTEDAGGRFAIDAESGVISVAEGSVLDFDEAASHEIGVQVTDSGGLSYTERLTVAVTNDNFAPTGVTLSDGTVAENAEAGTLVAKISADDPDADERLTYSLTEDAGGRFVIDGDSGRITVSAGASLDFEAETSHQLRVRVTDSGGLTHEEAVAIAVIDANEAPSAEADSFDVDETAGPGTPVGRLAASDPDSGDRGNLRYAITGDNSNGRFVIDPATGAITVAEGADLDFEDRRSFKIEATVTDRGGLSDGVLVAIDLVDRNEPPNGIRLISGKVPENSAGGRFAGQVAALDPDAGDSLTYELTEDAGGRFAIDSRTGALTVAHGANLDFEAADSHQLTVRVTDSGGLTYDEVFSIALTDTNEAPTAKEDRLEVAENATAGTLVGRLIASDPDAGDRLTYGLTDNAGGRFAIDRDTGAIMVADGRGLDFETSSGFKVTASVFDSGGLSDTVVVAVDIADLNEGPSGSVVIEGTVAENAAPGTLAAAYTATDTDIGDRVTYSLRRDAGGRFAIDPATGLITVAHGAKLDFEKAPYHDVTVRVTDRGGLTYDETLTIALLDVDETPATKLDLLAQHGAGTNGIATNGSVLDAVIAADNKLNENGNDALGKINRVAALQTQLVEAGFDPGPVDGKMGPLTRTALSHYQQAFKLTDLQDDDLLDHILVRAHFRRGYKYQAQGELEKSIAEYSEVVRIRPEHISAYYNRGLVYYEDQRYGRAIEDFDKVLGLRPDYAGAFVNRGNAYYRQGFYGQAAEDYATAIGYWIWPW